MAEEYDWSKITVKSNAWKPENAGESVQGVLVGREPSKPGVGSQYYIDTIDGRVLVWGSIMLDNMMEGIEINTTLRITYLGIKNTIFGRKMKVFQMEIGKKKV